MLTFLAVSFQDFRKAWQVAVQIFCAVHKPASGSKNCRDFCQVLEGKVSEVWFIVNTIASLSLFLRVQHLLEAATALTRKKL